ncbi:MAG TPA: hypothetical protein VLB74_05620 [Flavobacterium sp.]|uniref:hypothetical protein n=1 Tax=Flavobacterium sp. TaxID=239 RepID=UPI002C2A258C|nr:hypothetical protein [Flavobacterium sp.]HSD14105.1 hypothetical protein [Flavobacterium sp.]
MKNSLQKLIVIAVVLFNVPVVFSQSEPPPPPTPPPGLPIDTGVAVLLAGALGLAFYYLKNSRTKKASK